MSLVAQGPTRATAIAAACTWRDASKFQKHHHPLSSNSSTWTLRHRLKILNLKNGSVQFLIFVYIFI